MAPGSILPLLYSGPVSGLQEAHLGQDRPNLACPVPLSGGLKLGPFWALGHNGRSGAENRLVCPKRRRSVPHFDRRSDHDRAVNRAESPAALSVLQMRRTGLANIPGVSVVHGLSFHE